jgi:hypothetical protein
VTLPPSGEYHRIVDEVRQTWRALSGSAATSGAFFGASISSLMLGGM